MIVVELINIHYMVLKINLKLLNNKELWGGKRVQIVF
jgi:hypothetical protein